MRKKLNGWTIFSDFDGTITLEDSTEKLVELFGSKENHADEALFRTGEATNREVMHRHYESIKPTRQSFCNLLLTIPVDPGFKPLFDAWTAAGGPFAILTGNVAEMVEFYLDSKGIGSVTVYGNSMREQAGYISFKSGSLVEETLCGKGPCAFCKSARLSSAKEKGGRTIYIGDGLTDLCAAGHADILFAKASLADYCEKNGILCHRFESMEQVHRHLSEIFQF